MTIDVAEAFLDLLPPHKCGFHLEHNPHKLYHETVEDHCADEGWEMVSEDERLKAIETDELWTVQWYPETPIGFHALSAQSLGALLDALSKFPERS